ncbi:MAG: hypothetical protein N2317_08540 [Syntrophales bacterium]|nr:hypothetical protein [Syntrophales bacterium]
MANRYCNLNGTKKIKDEYVLINGGFQTVQSEMDTHTATESNLQGQITANENDIEAKVLAIKGTGYTNETLKGLHDLSSALQTQIDNLNSVYSTDAERIAAINNVINQFQIADDDLEALIMNKANSSDVYNKSYIDGLQTTINAAINVVTNNLSTLSGNVLQKNNTTVFVPNADYQPSTKKYVDDAITIAIGTVVVGGQIDYGLITDTATEFEDYGSI